jgi:hypothetical protein
MLSMMQVPRLVVMDAVPLLMLTRIPRIAIVNPDRTLARAS